MSITRANMQEVHALIRGGESMDTVLETLSRTASNAAIMAISSHNKMIGRHREDFRVRAFTIINSRKNTKQR